MTRDYPNSSSLSEAKARLTRVVDEVRERQGLYTLEELFDR